MNIFTSRFVQLIPTSVEYSNMSSIIAREFRGCVFDPFKTFNKILVALPFRVKFPQIKSSCFIFGKNEKYLSEKKIKRQKRAMKILKNSGCTQNIYGKLSKSLWSDSNEFYMKFFGINFYVFLNKWTNLYGIEIRGDRTRHIAGKRARNKAGNRARY